MVMHKVARVVQQGLDGNPMDGPPFPEGTDYVEDFDEIFLQDEENRCRALQPNATVSQPPPPASHSTTLHLESGGSSHHIMNGNSSNNNNGGHLLPPEQGCPVQPGLTNGNGPRRNGHTGTGFCPPSGISPTRQHQILMKMGSPSTPPATPPDSSPPHYQIPSSPGFSNGPIPGSNNVMHHNLIEHETHHRFASMVHEELGMWPQNHQGLSPNRRIYENPVDLTRTMIGAQGAELEPIWCRKFDHHPPHQLPFPSPQPPMGSHQQGHQNGQRMPSRDRDSRDSFDTRDSDSYCPSRVLPGELNEDQLIALPVRELNKRLHGLPRELVVKLKQKRRTLKNRGYAQNCRTKRLHQRNQLEEKNRALLKENHRLVQERDMWKSKFEHLRRNLNNNNPNQINQNPQSNGVSGGHPNMNPAGGNNHTNGPIHPNNHCNSNGTSNGPPQLQGNPNGQVEKSNGIMGSNAAVARYNATSSRSPTPGQHY